MDMGILDWSIVGGLLAILFCAAFFTKRYTRNVADFLAANRIEFDARRVGKLAKCFVAELWQDRVFYQAAGESSAAAMCQEYLLAIR